MVCYYCITHKAHTTPCITVPWWARWSIPYVYSPLTVFGYMSCCLYMCTSKKWFAIVEVELRVLCDTAYPCNISHYVYILCDIHNTIQKTKLNSPWHDVQLLQQQLLLLWPQCAPCCMPIQ